MKKHIKISLLTLIIALAALFLCSCGTKSINMKDCLNYSFEKYDGFGNAHISVNYSKINEYINKKTALKYISQHPDYFGIYADSIEELEEQLGGKFAERFIYLNFKDGYSRNYSNGDKVTFIFTIREDPWHGITAEDVEKAMGIKMKNPEITVKVKGLEKVDTVKIDTKKNIEVDFGLYNGYATPSITVSDGMFSEIIPEIWDEFRNNEDINYGYPDMGDIFDIGFAEPYKNVSNGDKLKVEIKLIDRLTEKGYSIEDIEKKLKFKLSDTELTYTVSRLEEAHDVINVFDGIEKYYSFSGANGYGQANALSFDDNASRQYGDLFLNAKISYKPCYSVVYKNKHISDIYYDIENKSNLKKGDKVKVTASFTSRNAIENLGYIISSDVGYITVPDLGAYLTSKEQVTPEVLEKIKSQIGSIFGYNELYDIYLATYKPGVVCDYNSTTYIVATTMKTGWFSGGYYLNFMYDIVIRPDGSVLVSSNNKYSSSSYDGAISYMDESKFTYELLYTSRVESEESEESEASEEESEASDEAEEKSEASDE